MFLPFSELKLRVLCLLFAIVEGNLSLGQCVLSQSSVTCLCLNLFLFFSAAVIFASRLSSLVVC